MGKKLLVTGGAGFVGSWLVREAIGRGYEVEALDAFRGGLYPESEKDRRANTLRSELGLEIRRVDLLDPDKLDVQADFVVHAAAMPGLDYSWREPSQYIADNEIATLNLIQAMLCSRPERFIHISTSSVYGITATGSEESETNPISPYGYTKLAAEKLVKLYLEDKISYSITRLFSVYGPEQRPDMGYHKFINAINRGEPINIFGDGSQSRTNTYVHDAVLGILDAIEGGKPGGIYNIGGGEELTVIDAISQISAYLDKQPILNFVGERRGDQRRTFADVSRAQSDFGYSPKTSFTEGIQSQIDWQVNR